MSSPQVDRIDASALSKERFLRDYVVQNRPVVVTGAMDLRQIERTWSPALLEKRFGDRDVQVYNNYFDLLTVTSLKSYIAANFGSGNQESVTTPRYVRWYTKLRNVEFCWADDVFSQVREEWMAPSFLPDADYLFPFATPGIRVSPVTHDFPAKGLFISPRGARTSLHVDPWGSCAALCQLYGEKEWYFYAPGQQKFVQNAFGTVDVTRPDFQKFPEFACAQRTAACTLRAGEVIYVPHGWYHQVECVSDSISITWNFVHRTTGSALIGWLQNRRISEFDKSVLRFFYRIPEESDPVNWVLTLIENRAPPASE